MIYCVFHKSQGSFIYVCIAFLKLDLTWINKIAKIQLINHQLWKHVRTLRNIHFLYKMIKKYFKRHPNQTLSIHRKNIIEKKSCKQLTKLGFKSKQENKTFLFCHLATGKLTPAGKLSLSAVAQCLSLCKSSVSFMHEKTTEIKIQFISVVVP